MGSAVGERVWRMVGAVLMGVLFGAPAWAAPDADAILRKAYENYRSQSSQSTVAMTIHRPAWERHLELKAWTRGEKDALVRFTAPAKDAGSATLELDRDTWVYNPRLNQVIKLPASMMAQSWMGSDFSYDDLAKSTDILTDYTHRLLGVTQAGGHTVWSVEATPKPGAPVVWGKVDLSIRDDYVLLEETFFDQDMKPARRMVAGKVGLIGGRPYPLSMTMSPLDQPGQWTRTDTADARFDIALPAWLFTLSNLQNPR
jgi:outer membrane lipoprotein-sorting protein